MARIKGITESDAGDGVRRLLLGVDALAVRRRGWKYRLDVDALGIHGGGEELAVGPPIERAVGRCSTRLGRADFAPSHLIAPQRNPVGGDPRWNKNEQIHTF
jgi:hypothetical protein